MRAGATRRRVAAAKRARSDSNGASQRPAPPRRERSSSSRGSHRSDSGRRSRSSRRSSEGSWHSSCSDDSCVHDVADGYTTATTTSRSGSYASDAMHTPRRSRSRSSSRNSTRRHSRSRSVSGSGSSNSSTSSGKSASSEEERMLRYPRFDSEYAERFRHELVPFLQRIRAPAAPTTTRASSRVNSAHSSQPYHTPHAPDAQQQHNTSSPPQQEQHTSSSSSQTAAAVAAAATDAHGTSWPLAHLRALRGVAAWVHTTHAPTTTSSNVHNISETSNSSAACIGDHDHAHRSHHHHHHSSGDGSVRRGSSSDEAAGWRHGTPTAYAPRTRNVRSSTATTTSAAAETTKRATTTTRVAQEHATRHDDSNDDDVNKVDDDDDNNSKHVMACRTGALTLANAAATPPHPSRAPSPPSPLTLQWLLYGSYVLCGVLGKGTYAKVVLARRLQRGGGGGGSDGSLGNGNNSNGGSGSSVVSATMAASSLVALKIFRDKTSYREACWDEVVVLRVLSQQVVVNANDEAVTPVRVPPPTTTTTRKAAQRAEGKRRADGEGCDAAVATHGHNKNNSDISGSGCSSGDGRAVSVMLAHLAHSGCYVGMIDYIPHPVHPAIVLPVMGPSLLRCLRVVRRASRAMTAAAAAAAKSDTRTGAVSADVVATSPAGRPPRARRWWRRGLPVSLVKAVVYQILLFLQYSHHRGIVHTDLKPENVLFDSNITLPTSVPVYSCTPPLLPHGRGDGQATTRKTSQTRPSCDGAAVCVSADVAAAVWQHAHTVRVPLPLLNSVRVTDFGTAQLTQRFTHISHVDGVTPVSYDTIQTTHYRSPEVILGVGWSASADIFSLGCMIPELLTGECMFMPNDTLEHLALMEHVIGRFADAKTTTTQHASTTMTTSTTATTTTTTPISDRDEVDGDYATDAEVPATRRGVLQTVYACNAATLRHYFCPHTGRLRWPFTQEERDAMSCAHNGKRAHATPQSNKQARRRRSSSRSQTNSRNDSAHSEGSSRGSGTDDGKADLPPLRVTSPRDVEFVRHKPTLDDLLGHDALLLDLTRRMLDYDPMQRITADEALQHPYFHAQPR